MSKFEEVAKRIKEIDTTALIENEWGDQDEAIKVILHNGKNIGVNRYRRMLNASKEDVVLEGEDKKTSGVFFADERRAEGGWGKMAKKQEKALRKLGQTLEMGIEVA